jgi:Transposase, Mutator family
MGHMKKYKCPVCTSTRSVIKYGYQNNAHRFFCKSCKKHFSINPYFINTKAILSDHLDGLSFRALARKYDIGKSHAWNICHEELKKLPDNNQFTHRYCNRFSQVLMVDGKYFSIANQSHAYVLLWGIDYFRHDIPVFTIAPTENYQSWAKFFSFFRILSCYPRLVVCDDNYNLKLAARERFPAVRIQTCYNHFKENIRRELKVRSEGRETYRDFMRRIERCLDSSEKINDDTFNTRMFALFRDYRQDPVCVTVLTNIQKYKMELLAYRGIPSAPLTTNLIEGMNKHIETRLTGINAFQSVSHARLWFNGYILKRRMTVFTDTKGKFKYLRGKTGVEMTKKDRIDVPSYFN